jgi:Sulfotransferase family
MSTFDLYHVDPATTLQDSSGRYSRNFVRFSPMLQPIAWADRISKALRKKPAPLLGHDLLEEFNAVGPLGEHWGTDDELNVLRKSLRLFSEKIDANPRISPIGRFLLATIMKGHLRNRFDTIAFYEKNRSFIEAHGKYEAPIIVTGFPRTGTTLLQRLLSEDPNTRSPYTYEMEKSVPPRVPGVDPLTDPRIEKSAATMATLRKLAPGFIEKFGESHVWSAVEREEAFMYMLFHCGVNVLNGIAAGREFMNQALKPEIADAALKYERNYFRMLDAYAPAKSHWTNKAPVYAAYFGKIIEHFPNARIIVTHRHPGKNMASCCRLFESWLVPFDVDGSFDKVRMGDILNETLSVLYQAPLEYRLAHPEHEGQIIDCLYHELFRDPIGMVKRIYQKFDLEYTQTFDERMKSYLENNKQGKYGRHRYSNAEYGLDRDALYERHKKYYDRYGYGASPEGHD